MFNDLLMAIYAKPWILLIVFAIGWIVFGFITWVLVNKRQGTIGFFASLLVTVGAYFRARMLFGGESLPSVPQSVVDGQSFGWLSSAWNKLSTNFGWQQLLIFVGAWVALSYLLPMINVRRNKLWGFVCSFGYLVIYHLELPWLPAWKYWLGVISIFAIWTLLSKTLKSKNNAVKVVGIVSTVVVALLVAFYFSLFDIDLMAMVKSYGFRVSVAALLLVSMIWRHGVVIKPKSWNIDPEAEGGPTPQTHWWGVWSNILTHLLLIVVMLAWGKLSEAWKLPMWQIVLVYAVLTIFTWRRVAHNRATDDTDTSFTELLDDDDLESLGSRLSKASLFAKIAGVVLLAAAIVLSIFVKLSTLWLAPAALYICVLLGGVYEPHVRARLVPVYFRKPRMNKLLLLGRNYLDNDDSPHMTLAVSWFPGHNVLDLDRATWEVEGDDGLKFIRSGDIPTSKEKHDDVSIPGTLVDISSKPTVRIHSPKHWFILKDDDRLPAKMRSVIIGYVIGALRSMTKELSYRQAKMDDYYEYTVRLRDVLREQHRLQKMASKYTSSGRRLPAWLQKEINNNMIQKEEYKKYSLQTYRKVKRDAAGNIQYDAVGQVLFGDVKNQDHLSPLTIKVEWVKRDDDGEIIAWGPYVTQDQDGVFIPATFFEYLDWHLLVLTGTRLIKFDVTDVTNLAVEKKEADVEIARLVVKEAEELALAGEHEGRRKGAARLAELAEIAKADPKAIEALVKLTGAEKASIHEFLNRWSRAA